MWAETAAMVPGCKTDPVGLGLKALLAGTIATCMTGAVEALIIS